VQVWIVPLLKIRLLLHFFLQLDSSGNTGRDTGAGAAANSEKALRIKSVCLVVRPQGSQLPVTAGSAGDTRAIIQVDDIAGIPCNT
jgi:hypothetical protein